MTDTLKLIFTYSIALVVIVGGGVMLIVAPTLDPLVQGAIIASIGSVIAFVFGGEVQSRTARQQERALLTYPTNGYTVTSATPTSVVVEQEEPTA